MMTTQEREERRAKYLQALTALSKQRHGKEYSALPADVRVQMIGEMRERHPALALAFDEPYVPIEHAKVHDVSVDLERLREPSGTKADVRRRYNFSVEDVNADPLKQSLVNHIARSERQPGMADEFDAALREIGRKHGLDPTVYSERLEIGRIMVRQRHKLAERA